LVAGGVLVISAPAATLANPPGPLPSLESVVNGNATVGISGHTLSVNQSSPTATLQWNSFNIAAGNAVVFNQPGSASIALNNIQDSNASQILGNLTANGQIYLVNHNGIVFGPTASVNANTLVASSLDVFANPNFDPNAPQDQQAANLQFSAKALQQGGTIANQNTGATLTAAFSCEVAAGAACQNVTVEKGAVINAADQGRVILAAPVVENAGLITAPDGQVIMVAASDKVYMQESGSSDLRGLVVEVNTGGSAKNLGAILTARGNTTMMGFAVAQDGVISASTSVALNGSVRLLAREGQPQLLNANAGTSNNSINLVLEPNTTLRGSALNDGLGTQASVTFGPGSSTNVTLDASGGAAVAGQAQPQSIVDVEAGAITMQAGSQITAPGGLVNLSASLAPSASNAAFPADPAPDQNLVGGNSSRILLETGSGIDVSGAQNVAMAMADNIVNLTLYSYELRNDPVQQHGLLYGQNVYVDARLGTALADVSGVEAARQFSVAYRNVNAGTVNLASEGDVIVQAGANINISGGTLAYQGGWIDATYLYANGALYSMADANPNLIYQHIFNTRFYQEGYSQGMNAGAVNIKSRDLVLDGNILAVTTDGQFQRNKAELPGGGSLSIDTLWSNFFQQEVIFQNNQTDTAQSQYGNLLNVPLYLSNALFGNGLQNLTVKSGGSLTIEQGVDLTLPDFGTLNLQAGDLNVYGNITAPAGTVMLSSNVAVLANNPSGEIQVGQMPLPGGGELSTDSVINVSGLWVNDFIAGLHRAPLQILPINAGSINIQADGDLRLAGGSQLLANGGAWLQNNLKLSDGAGGNITLSTAGNDVGSVLQLNAALASYSLSNGGALSITANSIDIANPAQIQDYANTTLDLAANLLETGGFSSYLLTANAGNLTVEANTVIVLQQTNWQLDRAAYTAGGGQFLNALASPFVLAENLRDPVDLILNLLQNTAIAGYVADRSIKLGQNSAITSDPGAALTLTSDANIGVAGTLSAPAGAIKLTLTPLDNSTTGYNPNQAIVLGAGAVLNAAGATVPSPNNAGLILGNVLAGGTVSLMANNGYIVTDAASLINVSGANASLDISNIRGETLQNVAANAGEVNLTAADGMVLQGKFLANAGAGQTAGGGSAAGGSLNLTLNAQNTGNQDQTGPFPTNNLLINISETPLRQLSAAQIAAGLIPASLNGQAYISASQINQAGFDSLKLASLVTSRVSYAPTGGAIMFDGDVSLALKLSLELDAPLIGHNWNTTTDSGQVLLSADMFTLGSSLNQTALGTLSAADAAVSGNGASAVFNVSANNIELRGGGLISGFAKTLFDSRGDISLLGVTNPDTAATQSLAGSLGITGELDLQARDIYPATLSQFTITDASANGLIKILPPNGAAYTPFAAAGQLSLIAPTIDSYGNLVAPFGSISLNASTSLTLEAGSLTSVSDSDNLIIPFGQTQNSGLYWQYPILNNENYLSATPQKAITLAGPTLELRAGAVVNLNGGGDLLAYELVPAPGGGIDYLQPAYQQSYVIIPSLKSGFAPYDYLEFPGSGLSPGESIHLSATADGLAAGNYVLLPSYYAFLPGAFLITPQAGAAYLSAGATNWLPDGAPVVAGYLQTAGSNVSASLWSGFEVQPGSVAAGYSPYQISYASQYFAANTSAGIIPSLPQDAGNLSLLAAGSLNLAGEVYATAAAGGLGGQLDISGDNFLIGAQANPASTDTVFINATQLSDLGVDSILIGGSRSRTATGTTLTVKAYSIDVAATTLTAPEIILAATNSVTLETGATVSAVGNLSRTDSVLNIVNACVSRLCTPIGNTVSDGALLRVSSAGQAEVIRSNADGASGALTIDYGTKLSSSGSILLDASGTGSLLGDIQMNQGQLTLSGNAITLGDAANTAPGFQLSNTTLSQLHVDNLTLNSAGTVAIAGGLALQQANLDLTINATGIAGVAGATGEQNAIISAADITLQNSSGNKAATEQSAAELDRLTLQAGTFTLGAGNYSFRGFIHYNLTASTALIDSGAGTLSGSGDLIISTPVWTAVAGANTTLNLGANTLSLLADGATAGTTGLGALLTVNAGQIDDYGRIDMGAGQVSLNAANNLTLYSGSLIDVSGRMIMLGDTLVYTVGGAISLLSNSGNLAVNSGAALNVSGSAAGAAAGSLTLNAVTGTLTLAGNLSGLGYQGASGGSFLLDAKNVLYATPSGAVNSDFSTLNNLLRNDGFNANLLVRQGQGNIDVAASDQVNAANITLTADNGVVDVAGTLNVSAAQAGTIALSGNAGVTLESTAKLYAETGNPAYQGGGIVLTSDPVSNQGSGVTLAAGAELNVSGGGAGGTVQGGVVTVIANRTMDSNGNYNAQVTLADGAVQGATDLIVYAMQRYVLDAPGQPPLTLSNDSFQQWLTDGANYNATLGYQGNAILANLGGFNMQPGLDIQSNASLAWNITTPLTGAGLLSIRSAGNLDIKTSLSDGFTVTRNGQVTLINEPTWSYNLVAGANLASANLQDILGPNTVSSATTPCGGSECLTIEKNTSINTGGGEIFLAAAGNIKLTDDTSTVYTAGRPSTATDPFVKNRAKGYSVQYPDAGGAVTLNAGGDIIGAASTQLMSDWLQRSGNLINPATAGKNNLPTTWGIDFGTATPSSNLTLGFRENIGALGGGNVNIHAGGNINDLSVMLPATAVSTIVNGVSVLHEQGGGNLTVTAGGNIAGGVFYVEKGYADISAGEAISGGSQYTSGPVFALGAAQFNVNAGDGIAVGAVLNPFLVLQSGSSPGFFTTYAANSGITLQSLAGNISLNNNVGLIMNQLQQCSNANCPATASVFNSLYAIVPASMTDIDALLALYPGNLTATAFTGAIEINGSMSMAPAAGGGFALLAAGAVSFAANVVLNQLDADPNQLQSIFSVTEPQTAFNAGADYWIWSKTSYQGTNAHAAQALHASDAATNLIVSALGSIFGLGDGGGTVNSAKAISVFAAQDLNNVSFIIQNLDSVYQDVSSISVGGDILYPATLNPVTGAFESAAALGITIAGPGLLNVWAGGNVNLGDSPGITSIGSQYNPNLPAIGAGITVLAGGRLAQNSQPLDAYLQTYTGAAYQASLTAQLSTAQQQPAGSGNQQLTQDLEKLLADIAAAQSKLGQAATTSARLQLALPILFDQFDLTATEQNTPLNAAFYQAAAQYGYRVGYQAGYDAINLLFPNKPAGDITLDYSDIHTLEGGDINLLAPGGMLNVGLAAGKSAAQLGVITEGQGNINILTQGDVQVNQSKVLTLDAGNITAWSSDGNIDAGRGAQSSLAAQAPTVIYDAGGNLNLTYRPTVSDSGIRAQSGYHSPLIGNVTLLAPHGVVNAGEAGIGGYNVTIAALAVLGASNIQAQGTSIGVSQLQSNFTIPDSAGNAAAGAGKSAMLALLPVDEQDVLPTAGASNKVALIDMQVIGFGKCSIGDVREGKQGCGGQ